MVPYVLKAKNVQFTHWPWNREDYEKYSQRILAKVSKILVKLEDYKYFKVLGVIKTYITLIFRGFFQLYWNIISVQ